MHSPCILGVFDLSEMQVGHAPYAPHDSGSAVTEASLADLAQILRLVVARRRTRDSWQLDFMVVFFVNVMLTSHHGLLSNFVIRAIAVLGRQADPRVVVVAPIPLGHVAHNAPLLVEG